MTQVQVQAQAALYCKQGGSDKVYGLALVVEEDGSAVCVIGYGPRGAVGKPTIQRGPLDAMQALYTKKLREKSKDYKPLDALADDPDATLTAAEAAAALRHIWTVLGGADGHPALAPADGTRPPPALTGVIIPPGGPKPQRVRLSHVRPIRPGTLDALLADPRQGVTEKMNGRRCVIVGEEDGTLRAYNRQGYEVAVPAAAAALARLGGSFIVDGEALERDHAGAFIAFDYLARHSASLRSLPYAERIARLVADFLGARLIDQAGATVARMVPTVPGLGLLFPATTAADKRAVLAEVAAAGGEGIIVRDLDGPSLPGDTRHELKWKLKGELDVVVLEHQLRGGQVDGTFLVGVRREVDGAWIALGNANTGLSKTEFAAVKAAVDGGQPVVLRLEFLSARSVGITPVEPVVLEVRTDKTAEECTASQLVEALGQDRAALIAAAPAWTSRARAA